ncbi:MAG TPA: DUF6600 domain-containing protein [Steroidobacteraceae bacterium]|nr:DUF6600 domain-containing protein [Steroidobacteraceae bacterium]
MSRAGQGACLGRLALVALLALFAAGSALADESDPPGRAARVSYLAGSVSLEPAGVDQWTAAELNRPLTTGDRLWTDADSAAELDIGAAVIRLGASTGFSFLNLDDTSAQMQLAAGTLIVRVWDLAGDQNYEVDTPNVAVSLQQPGVYRVEVDETGGATVVKVSDGAALAAGEGGSVPVSTQRMVTFIGPDASNYAETTLGAPDDFDEWSAKRDRRAEDSPSRQYVADDVAGTDSLDDSGRWQNTAEYGYVWTPTVVAVGWVPYRFGHWAWIGPWGWTWVDDAPWGYAPFHYGRWVTWHGGWCWVPGPRRVRPVFAPALVAWTGGPTRGPGAGVGWFPLGPREVYVPGYRVSETYLRNVNVSNTTIVNNTYITNVYENRVTNIRYVNSTVGAITAVPQNVFTSGQRVSGHTVRVSPEVRAGITVSAAAPAIAPVRQSVLGAGTTTARSGAVRPAARRHERERQPAAAAQRAREDSARDAGGPGADAVAGGTCAGPVTARPRRRSSGSATSAESRRPRARAREQPRPARAAGSAKSCQPSRAACDGSRAGAVTVEWPRAGAGRARRPAEADDPDGAGDAGDAAQLFTRGSAAPGRAPAVAAVLSSARDAAAGRECAGGYGAPACRASAGGTRTGRACAIGARTACSIRREPAAAARSAAGSGAAAETGAEAGAAEAGTAKAGAAEAGAAKRLARCACGPVAGADRAVGAAA